MNPITQNIVKKKTKCTLLLSTMYHCAPLSRSSQTTVINMYQKDRTKNLNGIGLVYQNRSDSIFYRNISIVYTQPFMMVLKFICVP